MKILNKSYLQEISGIFSCVIFCVYSWLLLVFFWDLPAFLFYLSAGDIVGYLAYQFTFALGESIFATLFITALVFLIPAKRIKSNAVVVGSLLVFSFAIAALVFKELSEIAKWLMQTFSIDSFYAIQSSVGIWVFSMLALPIISVVLASKSRIARFIRSFIDSLYVLVMLYASLSVLSVFIVIYRNIP